MSANHYSVEKVAAMFGNQDLKSKLIDMEKRGIIPKRSKFRSGALFKSGWTIDQIPIIGEKAGFLSKFEKPVSFAVFTTKGGVLKSTLALNVARMAALHNIKTCVVGLDIQGDITTAIGYNSNLDESGENINQILNKLNQTKGLSDLFSRHARLENLIVETDLPNLFLIPETPELVALNDSLNNINRREFWLKEKVIDPLKEYFDLIVMDCSPNWNKLTTNALVACDLLLSPLECKINNFRNFKIFRHFLDEFKNDMHLQFESIFIPTRFSSNRKLSMEIKDWYMENVQGHTNFGIRENVSSEEATALKKSILEHTPNKGPAIEMRELLKEIHARTEETISKSREKQEWKHDGMTHGRYSYDNNSFLRN